MRDLQPSAVQLGKKNLFKKAIAQPVNNSVDC